YRRRSPPRPAPRAAPTQAPRRADTPPCRAGAGPANRQNSSEKQLLQQRPHDPPWRPSSQPSIKSQGSRRIQSLTALSPTPSPDCPEPNTPDANKSRFVLLL